jgi:hypothetical protein
MSEPELYKELHRVNQILYNKSSDNIKADLKYIEIIRKRLKNISGFVKYFTF